MADSQGYADKINSLNSPMAKGIVKGREKQMDSSEGGVLEENLSDSKQRIRNQAYAERKKR
jgi:hypothetical protein